MRTRTYDPFGWRLVELSDPFLNPLRRTELLQDLVTCEAEELARGRRHVTIVHGVPCDLATATLLEDVYDTVRAIAGLASWTPTWAIHADACRWMCFHAWSTSTGMVTAEPMPNHAARVRRGGVITAESRANAA